MKYRKAVSTDAFIDTTFMFTKAAIMLLLGLTSWGALGWYIVGVVSVFLVFGHTNTTTNTNANTNINITAGDDTTTHHSTVITHNGPNTSFNSSIKRGLCLVLFYASWLGPEYRSVPSLLNTLATRYGGKMKCLQVDVKKWPEVARSRNINISPSSQQLPTLILFKNGVEVRRMPTWTTNHKIVAPTFSEKSVIEYFGLEN